MSIGAIQRAGLDAIQTGPSAEALISIYDEYKSSFIGPIRSSKPAWHAPEKHFFQLIAELMVEDLIQSARAWRADIIVHTPYAAAAPIAAAKLGLPSVFLGIGLEQTPKLQFDTLYSQLEKVAQEYAINICERPSVWIDVAPASLSRRSDVGIPMRYISYNGSAFERPVLANRRKPRIAVTMGTVIPHIPNCDPFREILNIATEIDVEFVIAGGRSPKASAISAKNVQSYSWIPMDALLDVSDAVIHHGGSGTMLMACNAALPQLILPLGADQLHNADAIQQRHNGLVVEYGSSIQPETVMRLLQDELIRSSAIQVREEMRKMSPPAELVETIMRAVMA
jgi:UDP:flavonoid glycosyltransferase YjiC (YdhE family)